MKNVKIGAQLAPRHGDMALLREAWMEAEALGADALYSADHFFAQVMDSSTADKVQVLESNGGKNFEATTVQAAMAATTSRAQIGCIVHSNSYRNPNLMADIARTIDHISGGRFVLGIGAGYFKLDYDEYGYEFGTQKSRLEELARNLLIIKARFEKLNPKPLRKIPILIPSMGEKIGMRIVADHADIWSVYGPVDRVLEKQEVMRRICREVDRDYDSLEQICHYVPEVLPDVGPDVILEKFGIRNIVCVVEGPNWDLGLLRELLAWRKQLATQ
jgi:probable F420-dependent oxidoreductase